MTEVATADLTVEELHTRYLEELDRVVRSAGLVTAAAVTGLDRSRLEALPGQDAGLTLAEASAVLALDPEHGDAEQIRREIRDRLILAMSSAVIDVEALSSAMGGDLGPQEYQQMIEGRTPLPLREYARIYHYVLSRSPY